MNIDLTGRVGPGHGQHARHRARDRRDARRAAARGSRVVGRDQARAEEVAAAISPEARGFACDVGDTGVGRRRSSQQVEEAFGALDILVNNAGITRDNMLLRLKDDDWDAVLDANLRGAFVAIRAAARGMMKRRWGRIINIASVVGLDGQQGAGELRRQQGRADRAHQVGGQGARLAQHPGQRRRAGLHRDRHDRGDDPRGPQRRSSRRFRSSDWARPRISPAWWRSWRRSTRRTSPGRSSWWTAAW